MVESNNVRICATREAAGNLNFVTGFSGGCLGQYRVKAIGKGTKHHVGKQNRRRQNYCKIQSPQSTESANRSGTPHSSSGIQSAHIGPILENNACTEEANS
jgi:hypothetical protein